MLADETRPASHATAQRPSGATRFRLIETMRAEGGRVAHLDDHLARLRRSAQRFDFAFSEKAFRAEVQRVAQGLAEGPHRLRLTLGRAGDLDGETAPLDEQKPQEPLRVAVAEERADSTDPFFRHKTTWRRVYRKAFRNAQERGLDDALLLNERREVTEATRANLFLEKDGACHTPPVRCGLLPGVGRAAGLERAEKRVLTPRDLRAADALWLVSALRGRRRAVWGT